jgi:hypothetical protein
MRRGTEGTYWRDENSNQIVAVNLGADFCAEHEWGIKGIQNALGIQGYSGVSFSRNSIREVLEMLKLVSSKKVGVEARQMTRMLPTRKLIDNLNTDGVKVTSGYGKNKKEHLMWGLALIPDYVFERFDFSRSLVSHYNPEKEELIGHWGEDDFGFICEDRQVVEDMKEAFEKNDIAIWTGRSGPFQNGGLVIAIASRLPEWFKKEFADGDNDHIELERAAADTGIYEKLEAAGKKFFALSPRWKDKEKKEVVFWLNPYDQQDNNFGWYEVSDLIAWTKNEGPIPKKK